VLSNRFKCLHRDHYTHEKILALASCQTPFKNNLDSLKIIWFWDLTVQVCMEGSGTHGGWNQPEAVFSVEHPPAWEQILLQLSSRVKGVYLCIPIAKIMPPNADLIRAMASKTKELSHLIAHVQMRPPVPNSLFSGFAH
jgi:hypothetical protein